MTGTKATAEKDPSVTRRGGGVLLPHVCCNTGETASVVAARAISKNQIMPIVTEDVVVDMKTCGA